MYKITTICKTCILGAALLQGAFVGAATLPDELITDPQGTTETWTQSGECFHEIGFGYLEVIPFSDYVTKFVYGTDGDVYLKNPVANLVSNTYVKGTISGDKLTLTLPQLIMINDAGEKFYIGRMNEKTVGEQRTFEPETENSTVTFTLTDGEWKMEESDGEWILGMFSEELVWAGMGSWNVKISRFTDTAVTAPAGIQTQRYAMRQENSELGRIVNVGFDGDTLWMKGLVNELPDAWVKGTVAGDKVTFKCPQYLGELDAMASLLFFQGAEFNEDYDMIPVGPVEMTFDAGTKSFSYDKIVVINTQKEGISYHEYFSAPSFSPQPDKFVCQPQPARIFYVMPYDESYGLGQCVFFYSNLTEQGNVMPLDKLYFRVYVDDELYTFYPDEYPCFVNPTTEVPLTIKDQNGQIQIQRDQCMFTYTFYGFDTIGVQVVYRDGDDVQESQIYTYDLATNEGGVSGVKDVERTSSTPLSQEWYDLSGRKVSNPDKGVYVKRVVYDDGHVENIKIMK